MHELQSFPFPRDQALGDRAIGGSCSRLDSLIEAPLKYAIVIERAENRYSGYVPEMPGCVATGSTFEEVTEEIREAIEFHLEGKREDGLPIPLPQCRVEYIEITA